MLWQRDRVETVFPTFLRLFVVRLEAPFKELIAGLQVTPRQPCWWSKTRVSLRWEMNSILMQILQKNFFCIDHQHGRLVTWLQTKNRGLEQPRHQRQRKHHSEK